MSAELEQKREHLASLEAFLNSLAHDGYIVAVNYDIEQTKIQILNVEPITECDRAEHFKLHGELRLLEQMLTVFQDARGTLKSRIDEMAEAELQHATETKK